MVLKYSLKDYKSNFRSHRKIERQELNSWLQSTYVFLISAIVWLLFYYVWILNANATQGYNIRKLEDEKRNLLFQQQVLESKIADIDSLDTVLDSKEAENMEKVENHDFIVIKDDKQYTYNY